MSGWGSGPWGSSPWGIGTPTPPETVASVIDSVNIYASDLLEVLFTTSVKNNTALQSASTYAFVALDSSSAPVTVKRVITGTDSGVTKIYLVITPPTVGAVYTLTIASDLRSITDLEVLGDSAQFTWRRTKVDSLCVSRPAMYDLRDTAVYRNILNAIGREDDRIGGSQDEGDDIIR